jgi:transposase
MRCDDKRQCRSDAPAPTWPCDGRADHRPPDLRRRACPLCGVGPVEASSGRTDRHRLNHGDDRQADNALWVIALTRLRIGAATRAYAQRPTTQGKST